MIRLGLIAGMHLVWICMLVLSVGASDPTNCKNHPYSKWCSCDYEHEHDIVHRVEGEVRFFSTWIGVRGDVGLVTPINLQEPINTNVTGAEKTVINRSNDPIWFDSSEGTVRPIAKSRGINVDDRHDSIAGPVAKTPPGWWGTFVKNLSGVLSWLFQAWPVLLVVCLVSLVLLVGFILYHYVLEPELKGKPHAKARQSEHEKAKLLDLPFDVEPSMLGLFSQAERYRASGDYSNAIVYLFSYALVEMDGARYIRLARGKTNRAYLRELKGRDNLQNFTQQLVQAFEYAFFGKHVLSQDSFELIWGQVPTFESTLKQSQSPPNNLGKLAKAGSA